ncbi:hypothetical protein niasHS_016716 [Heterodera schachtii]|uniref:Integrase catalytic domain-containing protein n=1 Tax=Heterodera schachtii TaxID=97005 RepID=A0ABD2I0T0_HETSC
MTTKSEVATIERLRYLFTRHGVPQTLATDNATQFAASEFAKSQKQMELLITFPLHTTQYPMDNRNSTFKRSFRKKGRECRTKKLWPKSQFIRAENETITEVIRAFDGAILSSK